MGSNTLVLYVGVTSELIKRSYQHKHGVVEGFTRKYKVHKLLYYEVYSDSLEAIKREKQLKSWHRDWKLNLIKSMNPDFNDLYAQILK